MSRPTRRVFSDALTLHKSSVTLNLRSRPDGDVSISSALTAPVEHNPRLLYAAAKTCSNDTTHRDGPSVLLAPFRASKTSAKTPARCAPVRFRQWACPPPRACPPVMCRQQPDALRGKIPVARPDTGVLCLEATRASPRAARTPAHGLSQPAEALLAHR